MLHNTKTTKKTLLNNEKKNYVLKFRNDQASKMK